MVQFELIQRPIITTLLATRCVTIGLSGCRIQQRLEFSDFVYGEFYYHRRGLPLWYFNCFEPSLTGSRLQVWLDENVKRFGNYESPHSSSSVTRMQWRGVCNAIWEPPTGAGVNAVPMLGVVSDYVLAAVNLQIDKANLYQ
jgi:hypothetical protein